MGLENSLILGPTFTSPIVLHGCKVWGPNLVCGQIERIQKHMVTSFLRIKPSTPYEIMLVETRLQSLELEVIRRLFLYRQKATRIENKRIPNQLSKETIQGRKNT
jgi:hypothetical protein